MKHINRIFFIISFCVFSYLILGEIFLPADDLRGETTYYEVSFDWNQVLPDGTKEPFDYPGKCGEHIVLEATVPNTITDSTRCISFRGEELQVYVDDELRREYNTRKTKLFGNYAPEVYLLIPLTSADIGKTISIRMQTDTGILYPIYAGTEASIWRNMIKRYAAEIAIGVLTFVLGLSSVLGSLLLRFRLKRRMDLAYLGCGVMFAAIYIFFNSVFRQLVFPNISVVSDFLFLIIMLIPYPYLIYLNRLQEQRYEKLYLFAGIVETVSFVACMGMHMAGIQDLYGSFIYIALTCFVCIACILISIGVDLKKGFVKEYKYVAIGFFCAITAAAVQIVMYFVRTSVFNCVILAAGLILLLLFSTVNTAQDIFAIERSGREAVLANQLKGKLLVNISHEIRTPINAILGMNAMVLRESKEPQILDYAMDIQNAGQNLLSQVSHILDFSGLELGQLQLLEEEYDVKAFFHDIENIMKVNAEEKKLHYEQKINSMLPKKLCGDSIRLQQILNNLLDNAIRYTQEGNVSLIVKGEVEGDVLRLHVSIEDTGVGISEAELSKLLGTGKEEIVVQDKKIEKPALGISITKELLGLMGSKLRAESEPGKGSHFYFAVEQKIVDFTPIGTFAEKAEKKPAEKAEYKAAFTAPQAKVLVVDDNMVNLKVFSHLLKATQMQVTEASGGQACLELVQKEAFDIIFLDHMMPEMDGIETLHHLKAMEENLSKEAPVIALTANAVAGAKEMYLAEGFDEFISKPIMPDALENMIVRFLPKEKFAQLTKTKENAEKIAEVSAIQFTDINIEYAELFQKDRAFIYQLLQDFYKAIDRETNQFEELYQKLSTAPSKELIKEYRITVHAVKSRAAMIGALPLNGVARMLEEAAAEERLDTLLAVTPAFLTLWRSYKEKLKECAQDEDTSEKEACDVALAIKKLERLKPVMEDMEIDEADEIVLFFKEYSWPENVRDLMEKLYVAIDTLDSDHAIEIVDQILEHIK